MQERQTTTPALSAGGLNFSYTKNTAVLSDVGVEVKAGETVGLVGPNGSGKTTLIKLIFDLLELPNGTVNILGNDHRTPQARLSSIYLPSDDGLPEFLTGWEYLRTVADLYGQSSRIEKSRASSMFGRFGMKGRENQLIEDYSHGMRKKTQLIGAFLLRLPLTVIDETFNGIDLDALGECRKLLRELQDYGNGILLCTHDFPLLEKVADRVIVMAGGTVIKEIHTQDCGGERLDDRVSKVLSC